MSHVLPRLEALRALPRPTRLPQPRMQETTAWKRPPAGWIKINFDVSVRHKVAGFGCLARDEEGEVLAAATLAPVLMQSIVLAEALCFRWALRLAIDLGFHHVCFETDSLKLF